MVANKHRLCPHCKWVVWGFYLDDKCLEVFTLVLACLWGWLCGATEMNVQMNAFLCVRNFASLVFYCYEHLFSHLSHWSVTNRPRPSSHHLCSHTCRLQRQQHPVSCFALSLCPLEISQHAFQLVVIAEAIFFLVIPVPVNLPGLNLV